MADSRKTCSGCGEQKLLEAFSLNKASPDGRHSRCKVCRKAMSVAYRARPDVAEKETARLKAHYERNREECLQKRKERYQKTREETLEKNRAWRDQNLDKHRALCREWARAHPDDMRVIVARRRAKIAGAVGSYKKSDVAVMLGSQKGLCAYCGADLLGAGYHVDHVHPISRGGSNGPENLQLLCPPCNRRKGAKLPEELRGY